VVLDELLGRDFPAYRFGELLLIEQPERLPADAALDGIRGDDLPQLLELGVQLRLDRVQSLPPTGVLTGVFSWPKRSPPSTTARPR
jgi:hypothetical protein